jgi:glycosyltransferase involved in cell wall biosynthesis
VTDFVHNSQLGYEVVATANPYLRKKRNVVIPLTVAGRLTSSDNGNLAAAFASKRNILFVGQVAKHKGVDLLLEAFERLAESQSGVTLHLVGGCDDPGLKEKLVSNGLGTGCGIRYWGYRDDVPQLLEMADVLVQPSPSATRESFGRVVVEAMSVGVPAVCFRSGALQEIVVHEETGLVCDDESSACLAANLERLLNDDELRESCARKAKLRYHQSYSSLAIKEEWLRMLGVA